MKLGQQVAFLDPLDNQTIWFGIIVAIITRKSITEESTKYVVSSVGADGTANSDVLVEEDNIVDIDGWRKAEGLFDLAKKTTPFQWMLKKAHEIDEPRPPPTPDPVEPTPDPEPNIPL